MKISDCHNIDDFRRLAKARLPWPVFDYIDGAADDEITKARNTASYADCDLVPNVLAGVAEIASLAIAYAERREIGRRAGAGAGRERGGVARHDAVAWGYALPGALQAAGPTHLFNSIEEMMQRLTATT